jgi:protein TonB|tara:strand:- start:98 stop:997 length:900 start_codon:yes stop_codon:yes gene_type:complete
MASSDTMPLNSGAVDTADRLSFTVFLAVALHALLILGVSFSYEAKPKLAPTLQITLASHQSKKKPDEADYLAQFNQEASGTEKDKRELAAEREAPLDDSRINDITPAPKIKASKHQQQLNSQLISTRGTSQYQASTQEQKENQKTNKDQVGETAEQPPINQEIASLQAKLARQKQEYAKRPRKRFLTSVSTMSSKDAEYYARFQQKVERVGNNNYPPEAIINRIIGDLRMVTVVNANGTIADVEILHSSGHRLLDDAALQIVYLAAPFPPFSEETRRETDQLEIIRTWHFEITGLTTSN